MAPELQRRLSNTNLLQGAQKHPQLQPLLYLSFSSAGKQARRRRAGGGVRATILSNRGKVLIYLLRLISQILKKKDE